MKMMMKRKWRQEQRRRLTLGLCSAFVAEEEEDYVAMTPVVVVVEGSAKFWVRMQR